MASTIKQVGNGVSGIIIGGYLAAVIYQSFPNVADTNSNLEKLLQEAKQDYGYVEFLIAAVILKTIADVKTFRPFVVSMVVAAFIGLFLTKGNKAFSFLQDFANGKIGLLGETNSTKPLGTPYNPTPGADWPNSISPPPGHAIINPDAIIHPIVPPAQPGGSYPFLTNGKTLS